MLSSIDKKTKAQGVIYLSTLYEQKKLLVTKPGHRTGNDATLAGYTYFSCAMIVYLAEEKEKVLEVAMEENK